MREHGCGWVMVRAENNVPSILEALKSGAFYSSCGPEIYHFYVEGERAVVECSPVAKICFHCDMHPTRVFRGEGTPISRAELKLSSPEGPYPYIRASVTDPDGRTAWTNPIFLTPVREK